MKRLLIEYQVFLSRVKEIQVLLRKADKNVCIEKIEQSLANPGREMFDYINFLKSYLTECSKIKHKQNDFLFGISKPLARTSIKRIKNEACKAAGVKQIRIHDFRHTHASMLIEKGVDPIYVKERLGHDDISTTLNTYSHLFKNRRKSIIETIENL